MNYENTNEDTLSVINNTYDYSNIIPTVECIRYLVQYCDNVYKKFVNLMEEDTKKNEQFKEEFKNYNYKKSYGDLFEIYIREKSYNTTTCKDFATFESAVSNGHLKNVSSLEIRLELDYKRGKCYELKEHENEFIVKFKPYEITFVRKSNHNEESMNQIENIIKDILSKFPISNSIFCTK